MTIVLPEDIINNILSFGDPEISVKFSYCLKQLLYNKQEFDMLCNTNGLLVDTDFMYFILEASFVK
jgi:hypothetical protein